MSNGKRRKKEQRKRKRLRDRRRSELVSAEKVVKQAHDSIISNPPRGTKFLDLEGGKIIVEQYPKQRTIIYGGSFIRLSFPYVVFIINWVRKDNYMYLPIGNYMPPLFALERPEVFTLSRLQVGFSKTLLTKHSDKLCAPNLPNIDGSLGVCMGGWVGAANSLEKLVKETMDAFWQSAFTPENWAWAPRYGMIGFNFDNWMLLSMEEPDAVLGWPWVEVFKLDDLVNFNQGSLNYLE